MSTIMDFYVYEIDRESKGKGESFTMFLANMQMMYRGLRLDRFVGQTASSGRYCAPISELEPAS